jgi:RND family efflux transporter MFP subunit
MARAIITMASFFWLIAIPCHSQTVAPVKTIAAPIKPIAEIVTAHGIVEPNPAGDIKISAVSPMRIEKILVNPGDPVKPGQRLVVLQRDPGLEIAVEKAKINLQQAKVNLDRAKKLYENGVYPKVNYEQAQTEYKLAEADYDLQSRTLDFATKNSEMRSPIGGIVSSVDGKVGQIADPSLVIARIVNTRQMLAAVGLEIEDIAQVKVGQNAQVDIPNLPEARPFPGVVRRFNKEIDPSTQLVRVWIEIDNPEGSLQPGMFAVANITVKTDSTAIVVPRLAVLKDDKGFYLFAIENKTARKIYVDTGIQTDQETQIIKGIRAGQEIVYAGNYELEDGMAVRMMQ